MANILLVEDNDNTRLLMEDILSESGYTVFSASNAFDALEMMNHKIVDLIILDVMLPRMSGFDFARTLRESHIDTPIIIMTAKESIADKKIGFLSGADDYMIKPVDEEELLLRIAAVLRRYKIANDHILVIGKTKLDIDSMTVTTNGKSILIPQKEFLVLFKLLSYQGTIFTRSQLIDEIWGLDSETDWHTVDVHINRLRDKFGSNEDFEIVTVRGIGYKAVKRNV